jgi:hypothetical protein
MEASVGDERLQESRARCAAHTPSLASFRARDEVLGGGGTGARNAAIRQALKVSVERHAELFGQGFW